MTMQTETTPRLLKPKEAAESLAISERTLWALTASGDVASVRIGRSVRYDPADLAAFIQRQKIGGHLAC